jgi:hypothetical protein
MSQVVIINKYALRTQEYEIYTNGFFINRH